MKHKIMALVTLLCAALAAILAAACAEGNLLMEADSPSSLIWDGETLYVQDSRGLSTWRDGETALTEWRDEIDLPGPEDSVDEEGLFSWREGFDGARLFLYDGRLCGARLLEEGDGAAKALQLCDIRLDGGAIRGENVRELPVPKVLKDEGLYGINSLCVTGGVLYMSGFGEDGNYIYTVDSADPKRNHLEALDGWSDGVSFLPTAGGVLLAEEIFDAGYQTALYSFSLDAGRTELCDVSVRPNAIATAPDAEEIFVVENGRVRPLEIETGAPGPAVSALPLPAEGCALIDGGRRLAAIIDQHVAILDTTGELPEDGTLTVKGILNEHWFNDALLSYAVAHPEMPATLVYQAVGEEALDEMLTRSEETDVFVIGADDSVYRALLGRGYLLPLDGSATLSGIANRLYPGVREAMSREGALCALPLFAWSRGPGLGEEALERLGFALSDVPGTWQGFLDFIEDDVRPRLDRLGEHERFTYDEMEMGTFRTELRMAILNDWAWCAEAAGVVPDYEDPRLVGLLERVDGMDLSGYGLEEDRPREGDGFFMGGYSYGGDTQYLLHWQTDYAFAEYSDYDMGTPLRLGFGDDLPAVLPLKLTVACVNPFSRHREQAVALLEELADRLPLTAQYTLCPDLTVPAQLPNAEEIIAAYEENIARYQKELDEAEPSERQAAEQTVADWQEDYRRFMSEGIWLIPEGRLDWYRSHDDHVSAVGPTWFESAGEAAELMSQYMDGLISAREFLTAVNKKARMMALEHGN